MKINFNYQKYLIGIFLFSCFCVFLFPQNIFAQCSDDGYTVIYINGIFTPTKKLADADRDLLKDKYEKQFGINKAIVFRTGYNPSHLAGLGDVIESASQMLNAPISDYDFKTILNQIHSEIKTKKVILVGYSQGSFYANELYNYLINNGVSKKSISIFNVATPASYVSGNGEYATSKSDKAINQIREIAKQINAPQPLPGNIDFLLNKEEQKDPNGGHSFSGSYLKKVPADIISSIESKLKNLVSTETILPKQGCFNLPDQDWTFKTQGAIFFIVDPISSGTVYAAKAGYNGAVATANVTVIAAQKIIDQTIKLADNTIETIAFWSADKETINNQQLTINNEENTKTINNQQSTINNETQKQKNIKTQEQENTKTINNQQLTINNEEKKQEALKKSKALEPKILKPNFLAPILDPIPVLAAEPEILESKTIKPKTLTPSPNEPQYFSAPAPSSPQSFSSYSYSAPTPIAPDTSLPKILISEICLGLKNPETKFIELYNPNDQEIILNDDNFKLKFIDSENQTTMSSIKWTKNKIPSKGYFLFSLTQTIDDLSTDATFLDASKSIKEIIISDGQNNIKDKLTINENLKNNQSIERNNFENDAENFSLSFILTPTNSLNEKKVYNFQEPETILDKFPDAITNLTTAFFSFSSNESDVNFQYSLDDQKWEDGISQKEYSELKLGNHIFKVRAIDQSGNIDSSPIVFQWQIIKKVLPLSIAKIQIASEKNDNDEYIELFNPNDETIDLSDYSIQKKSSDLMVEKNYLEIFLVSAII
ncbi:hypothetical protein HY750_00685 [Candidatus Kuenenbacteria bacterium]|nr:hypothetical protein [Candidatus Kuenenbacteria bacterium]